MNIHEKLMTIQSKLKAPKNQFNSFGKYKYRSLEDISEAVKPLLSEVKATLTVSDEPVMIGDRIYIKATATITDAEDPTQTIINRAYAREADNKKGMDPSQVTGATSSYSRKYCLNGLFCIDDNKDADSQPPITGKEQAKPTASKSQTSSFENSMKQYAINYPEAYKKVLDRWQIKTAKGVSDFATQQGLLNEIETTINVMESVPA